MYGNVCKQSSFSRSLANNQKLGTYHTDIGMCKRIGSLFSIPEEEECCVLTIFWGCGNFIDAKPAYVPKKYYLWNIPCISYG